MQTQIELDIKAFVILLITESLKKNMITNKSIKFFYTYKKPCI